MNIINKTETEDTIFEFTLSRSGLPKNSFSQTLVYILRGKDGLDFAEIDISQIITGTGNFEEWKISQQYIEEPLCKFDGHVCHEANDHHDPTQCKNCSRRLL